MPYSEYIIWNLNMDETFHKFRAARGRSKSIPKFKWVKTNSSMIQLLTHFMSNFPLIF